MNKKKILALLVSASFLFAACGDDDSPSSPKNNLEEISSSSEADECDSDECYLSEIEWMKIKHVETVHERIGLLVPDKIQTFDHKSVILEILQKHSIPYEYNEMEQTFIIYGYR